MKYIASCLLILFCACSGSSSVDTKPTKPTGPTDPITPNPDPPRLPTSGRASYIGTLSLAFTKSGESAASKLDSPLTLNVDFAAPSTQISGTAEGFSGYTGKLALERGVINRNAQSGAPDFTAQLSGSLGETAKVYTLTSSVNGSFTTQAQGPAPNAVSMQLTGGSVIESGRVGALTGSYQGAKR